MGTNRIVIAGAREHNLKDISLSLPRDTFIVITGLSGSGKSSLAFDTIYAEGQRRYVESLSAYARQFLGQMNKPDVDSIEGLSPAISIDQKTTSRNPRSTVGTVTEVYDYLRLLFARIGHPHCWICGRPIEGQSKEQIVDQVMGLESDTRFVVKAPVVRGQKGWHKDILEHIRQEGFTRVEIDGREYTMDEQLPELDKNVRHDINIVVDRLVMKEGVRRRLSDSVETALSEAHGLLVVDVHAGDGGDRAPGRGGLPPACSSPRIWPVPSTGCRCRRWRPASSRSTRLTGPVRPAAVLGPGARSTRCWSSPIPRCRSRKARSCPGAVAVRSTTSRSSERWPSGTRSTCRRPGVSCPRRFATSFCTGRGATGSTCRT